MTSSGKIEEFKAAKKVTSKSKNNKNVNDRHHVANGAMPTAVEGDTRKGLDGGTMHNVYDCNTSWNIYRCHRKSSSKMPGKPDTDDWRVEHGEQIQFQPWWRAVGENASKSSSADQFNGSPSLPGTDKSGACGGGAKEYQNIKHDLSSIPFTMDKHLAPNLHSEFVGHSVVLASPYSDAQYGQILTTYRQQVMINPQLYGMHQARMPLPLEMEEEPVYVNAKQYHGILRRRQSRAKAELEKKVIKNRKPYLHESRHLHAMRRARGNGGRFLNTKKLKNDSSNVTSDKGNNSGANPSTNSLNTQHMLTNNENLGSSNVVQDMHRVQTFNNVYHNGNGLTALYHSQVNRKKEGDYFGKERDPVGAFK
ncbi:unnamed protein product [Sphenostylis stenocarpa]|uniref:Nuclear transcription factor Y subunit n=1 Tax=Sphenostylis stenocarpa TaxID=92480 RepID=A0AA86W479_9FABA|nr:unnamed protein product [Sphenostylis stenocarpa]